MSVTVSAKIPEELKHELEKADINVDAVIRTALEAEVRQRRRERLSERAAEFNKDSQECINSEDVVDLVRMDRTERRR